MNQLTCLNLNLLSNACYVFLVHIVGFASKCLSICWMHKSEYNLVD
jgi:hypothetical protein